MPKIDKFGTEYRRIQMELVHLLRQRICWNDRIGIANAMTAVRHDYESSLAEQRLLFSGDGECDAAPEGQGPTE